MNIVKGVVDALKDIFSLMCMSEESIGGDNPARDRAMAGLSCLAMMIGLFGLCLAIAYAFL